jgi:CDP-glucose 4,6-dehydratase
MPTFFNNIYHNLPVLVTGHTGFKGSWLSTWLLELGAKVIGYSLPDPPTRLNNFDIAQLGRHITDVRGDIGDFARLHQVVAEQRPRLIFHLAAQPIVLRSVQQPKLTIDINAGGTVNVLEAIRQSDSVRALVSVTTDKVYHNEEWLWGYREGDRLGGRDPYSASKAMAELAINAYRETYFPAARYEEHGVAVASARAGNVIGGGDFGDYRLAPDCMKALMAGEPIGIRNPLSVRPWQHVLESLSGYLWLGAKLLAEGAAVAEAWNFGPLEQKGIPARQMAEKLIELWGSGAWVHTQPGYAEVETGQLRLNWEKAATRLDWRPIYSWEQALAEIVAWFKAFQAEEDMHQVCQAHIRDYTQKAKKLNLPWAG